jgi:hypothetical protein
MGTASDVGLLTAPLSLVRTPLRLTLRIWEVGLSTAAEAARLGIELLGPDDPAPDFARRSPPGPADYAGNGQPPEEPDVESPTVVEAPSPAPDAPPAVPDELIPDHVDEEVVLVAETAEEGAEDGAGPELHIAPPWDGYDQMTAPEIRDRLAAADAAVAAAVDLYEATHKSRRTVIEAAERALRR